MDADVTVIGAGIIGLAVSYSFSMQGYSVILVEKEHRFGTGVSSRSSEQIHSGAYYEQNSLKALLCLKGKELLYRFCEKHSIAYKRTGKLFIAVDEKEIAYLSVTKSRAESNGLNDLVELDSQQLQKIEPYIRGKAALLSPSSGIVDSHALMSTMLRLSEAKGTTYACLSPVVGAEPFSEGWKVNIGGADPVTIKSKAVVNASGLYSIELSRKIFPGRETPEPNPVKGGYLRYSGKSPLKHIIYPAIIPGRIEERVDATPDLGGSLRFGPSVEIAGGIEDFSLSENLIDRFYPSIKRYFPKVDKSKLHLDQAGIRPKIKIDGISNPDFIFSWSPDFGWLDLWGMESPALTASLAIGDYVYNSFNKKDII